MSSDVSNSSSTFIFFAFRAKKEKKKCIFQYYIMGFGHMKGASVGLLYILYVCIIKWLQFSLEDAKR